ncbi:MAG: hypothetical protein KJ709_04550 [Nanoarchaeota archaeon]|nr:hypothetical protein [Nanoarchaeota archaeon]
MRAPSIDRLVHAIPADRFRAMAGDWGKELKVEDTPAYAYMGVVDRVEILYERQAVLISLMSEGDFKDKHFLMEGQSLVNAYWNNGFFIEEGTPLLLLPSLEGVAGHHMTQYGPRNHIYHEMDFLTAHQFSACRDFLDKQQQEIFYGLFALEPRHRVIKALMEPGWGEVIKGEPEFFSLLYSSCTGEKFKTVQGCPVLGIVGSSIPVHDPAGVLFNLSGGRPPRYYVAQEDLKDGMPMPGEVVYFVPESGVEQKNLHWVGGAYGLNSYNRVRRLLRERHLHEGRPIFEGFEDLGLVKEIRRTRIQAAMEGKV